MYNIFSSGGGTMNFGGGASSLAMNNISTDIRIIQQGFGRVYPAGSIEDPSGRSRDTMLQNQQDLENLLNSKLDRIANAIETNTSSTVESYKQIRISDSSNSTIGFNNLIASINTSQENIMNKLITDNSRNTTLHNDTMRYLGDLDLSHNTLLVEYKQRIDASMNDLFTNINNFIELDISLNQKLVNDSSNTKLTLSKQTEDLINKICEIDVSLNSVINKIVEYDYSMNTTLTEKTQNWLQQLQIRDASLNNAIIAQNTNMENNFTALISKIDASNNLLLNKIVDNNSKLDASFISIIGSESASNLTMACNIIDAIQTISTKIVDHDLSMNKHIVDKLTIADTSFNNALLAHDLSFSLALNNNTVNLVNKMITTDISFSNTISSQTQQLVENIIAVDISCNNRLADYDASFSFALSENTQNLINKLAIHDTSLNKHIVEQLTANDLSFCSLLTDKTQDWLSELKLKETNLTTYIANKNETLFSQISDTLAAISNLENNMQSDFTDMLDSLNIKSNETQQTLTKYIGDYIVLPLYKQRLNDMTVSFFDRLNDEVIIYIEYYLNLFKAGDFASLILEYSIPHQEAMALKIYDIKTCAFKKFLSTTPGAKGFKDMNDEAIRNYKGFRKYISWAYRSLDGLTRAIRLQEKYENLAVENTFTQRDSDILNDPEKLELFYGLSKKEKDGTLFSTQTGVSLSEIMVLKPRYQEYICRYGFPENMDFDSEKLALVTKDLIAAGVIDDPMKSDVENSASDTETGTGTATATGDETATGTGTGTDTGGDDSASTTDTDPSGNNASGDNETSSDDKKCKKSCDDSSSDYTCRSTEPDTGSNKSLCEELSASLTDLDSDSLDYCDIEDVNCDGVTTYFVYITIEDDPFHPLSRYYYPLFKEKNDAKKAVDVEHVNYNPNIDVVGNVYTPNSTSEPTGVTRFVFKQLPGRKFYMPNSHPYRSVGTEYHPPFGLEYVFYTPYTGQSGLNYNPKNKFAANSFEFNKLSLQKYLMESPTIDTSQNDPVSSADVRVSIPWYSDPLDTKNNWRKLFLFKSSAEIIDDLYSEEIEFFTDNTQWYGNNLLKTPGISTNDLNTYNTISFDFLKHLIKEISGNTFFRITNTDKLFQDLSNNGGTINSNIVDILTTSDACGNTINATNTWSPNVLPSTILKQLLHNELMVKDENKTYGSEFFSIDDRVNAISPTNQKYYNATIVRGDISNNGTYNLIFDYTLQDRTDIHKSLIIDASSFYVGDNVKVFNSPLIDTLNDSSYNFRAKVSNASKKAQGLYSVKYDASLNTTFDISFDHIVKNEFLITNDVVWAHHPHNDDYYLATVSTNDKKAQGLYNIRFNNSSHALKTVPLTNVHFKKFKSPETSEINSLLVNNYTFLVNHPTDPDNFYEAMVWRSWKSHLGLYDISFTSVVPSYAVDGKVIDLSSSHFRKKYYFINDEIYTTYYENDPTYYKSKITRGDISSNGTFNLEFDFTTQDSIDVSYNKMYTRYVVNDNATIYLPQYQTYYNGTIVDITYSLRNEYKFKLIEEVDVSSNYLSRYDKYYTGDHVLVHSSITGIVAVSGEGVSGEGVSGETLPEYLPAVISDDKYRLADYYDITLYSEGNNYSDEGIVSKDISKNNITKLYYTNDRIEFKDPITGNFFPAKIIQTDISQNDVYTIQTEAGVSMDISGSNLYSVVTHTGYSRLNNLLDSRESLDDKMQLLQLGDKIIFNITICKNNSTDPQLLECDPAITPRIYRVILTLL